MKPDRQIGLVFLFDQVTAAVPRATRSGPVGLGIQSRILRWLQHRELPATVAVVDPVGHPRAAEIRAADHLETALLVPGPSRHTWAAAADHLRDCRQLDWPLSSAVVVGDQPRLGARCWPGIATWAYWRPDQPLQVALPPWQAAWGCQVPLKTWTMSQGDQEAGPTRWRTASAGAGLRFPPPGRRITWVLPLMTFGARELASCEKLLRRLDHLSRHRLVELQTLSQTALSLSGRSNPESQRSILRAA